MRIQWTSDQHTLHLTTPTAHILGNMSRFYYKEHDLNQVALAIFGGDLTDRMVEAPNPDFLKLKHWGKGFLNRAHKAKTAVLVLEGTHSHDWGQPAHLETLAPEGMDFRYVDTLSVQFYPELDNLSILCVPDNMGALTPDEIWEMALQELKKHNLTQVDLIAFHGAFDFQIHPAARHKAHKPERWESIVKYYILAGHIHTPVEKGKIRCSGSFDRTRHGEEHPKGGYIVELDLKKETSSATFWENKKALPYVTMKVEEDITPEQLVKDLHHFIRSRKLPYYSQVRVMDGAAAVVNPIIAIFEKEYPFIGFKAENSKSKDVLVEEEMFTQRTYEGVELTVKTLPKALVAEVLEELIKAGISEKEALALIEEMS